MATHVELDPVDRVTVGAVGEPGSRVFLLQAAKGDEVHTWILEKEHVMALGTGGYALLAQIGQQEITKEVLGESALGSTPKGFDELMALAPGDPEFRIDPATMAMGYDEAREMFMLAFAELVLPEAGLEELADDLDELEDEGDVEEIALARIQQAAGTDPLPEDRATARLWLTQRQLAALGIQGMQLVSQGRPVCPLCGAVMEEGHECPKAVFNGKWHKKED
ncbi:MAG: DUF3090 family protein [Actinomycetota bacterium]